MGISINIEVDKQSAPIDIETGYVAIRESMDFFVPTGTLVFDDRMSNFVATYPFMQDTKVSLTLEDMFVKSKYDFRAFSSKKKKEGSGVEKFKTTVDLVSIHGEKLLGDTEFHSDTTTISSYVRYIAGQCGLKTDIEETTGVLNILNPNWTYAQMIRWCAVNAISATGSVGYLYYVTGDGTLVFRSPDSFFTRQLGVDLTIGKYEILDDLGLGEEHSNGVFTLNENLYGNVLMGANGSNVSYKEYSTGEQKETNIGNTDGISKRGGVRGVSVELTNKKRTTVLQGRYEGINSEQNRIRYNKATRQLETVQIGYTIPWRKDIGIGTVVNVTIPSNDSIIIGGVNMNYSGRYLVKSCAMVGHGEYYKKLTLVRPGLNLPILRKTQYI